MMATMSPETPWPVRGVVVFAWGVMALFAASLVAAFAGAREASALFERYAGNLIWVPYVWIAGVLWWACGTQAERRALVRFTTWTLFLAIGLGVVDLAVSGWLGGDTPGASRPSAWRLLTYWGFSALWLVLLRGQAVKSWIGAGTARPSPAGKGTGGSTRGD